MKQDLMNITQKSFEDIKHIDENRIEFWYARELQVVLGYKEWRKFEGVIQKAKESCRRSEISTLENFTDIYKTIELTNGVVKRIRDIKLTRYACYLIVQNGDSRKKAIAMAKTYIAFQTRKTEIKEKNQDINYKQEIFNNMRIDEVAVNLFRISLIDQKIKRENLKTEAEINKANNDVDFQIKETIKKIRSKSPKHIVMSNKSQEVIGKEKNQKSRIVF